MASAFPKYFMGEYQDILHGLYQYRKFKNIDILLIIQFIQMIQFPLNCL